MTHAVPLAFLVLPIALMTSACERSAPAPQAPPPPAQAPAQAQPPAATPPAQPSSSPGESTPPPAPAVAQPAADPWVLPAGWRKLDEAKPMRLATLVFESQSGPVEVAVTRFPGDVGGVLANVNRWRQQAGLTPVEDAEGLITRFERPGFQGYWLRIEGEGQHTLAAGVFEASASQTWFARVTAMPAVIDSA